MKLLPLRVQTRALGLVCCSGLALGLASVALSTRSVKATAVGAAGTGIVNPAFGSYGDYIGIDIPGYYNLQPALKLVYSSLAGNGFVGTGWSLSGESFVERVGPSGTGVPGYTSNDTFFLDGTRLIAGTAFGGTHVTKNQSYLRIQQDATNNAWYVWEKDGVKKTYVPIASVGSGFTNVYRWALSTMQDANGHVVHYNYWTDSNQNTYLDNITYNGYTIKLWRDSRPDPISFTNGRTIGFTNYRLKTIEVQVGGSDRCAYKLSYTRDINTNRSYLTAVQKFGSDVTLDSTGTVTGGTSAPAQTMTYNPSPADYSTCSSNNTVGAWNTSTEFFFADVNGDGKDDYVEIWNSNNSAAAKVRLSNGSDFNNLASDATLGGWNTSWHDFLLDVNGDGKADFVRIWNNGTTAYCQVNPSNGTGFPTQLWNNAIGGWNSSFKYYFADVNGDGYPDLIVLYTTGDGNARIQVNLNDGQGRFPTQAWNGIVGGWNSSFLYFFSDVDGDGKADLEVVWTPGDGSAHCQLNLSNGSGFPNVTSNTTIGGWNTSFKYNFVDLNADGKADLEVIYTPTPADGYAHCQINLSNGSGFPVQNYNGIFGGWSTSWQYYFADVNGDGRPDIVVMWQGSDGNAHAQVSLFDGTGYGNGNISWNGVVGGWSPSTIRYYFNNVSGDGKADLVVLWQNGTGVNAQINPASGGYAPPGLMTSISNGIGGTTNISYERSTDWPSSHSNRGGIIPTVSAVSVTDGRGNTGLTSYTYADANFSIPNKTFFGFGSQTAIVDDQNTTVVTHNRQTMQSLGQPDSIYTENSSGAIYGYTTYTYTESGDGVTTPYTTLLTQTSQFEQNLTSSSRQTRSDYTYDSYGNPTQITDEGDVAVTGDEFVRVVTYNYNVDATHYLAQTPASEQVYSGTVPGTNKVHEELYYYDGATSTTTPPTAGNVTRTDNWNDQTNGYVTARGQFDAYGNQVSLTNTRGYTETAAYDPVYHQYATSTTNALGQTTSMVWDYVRGVTTSMTSVNGFTSNFAYDALGRPTSATDPNGVVSTTQYLNIGDPNNQHVRRTISDGSTDGIWTDTYADGLGRTYMVVRKGPTSGVTYTKQVAYRDGQSTPVQASLWYQTGGTPVWETYAYDGIGRITKTTHADGTSSTATYTMDSAGKPCTVLTNELGAQRTVWNDTKRHVIHTRESNQGATYDSYQTFDVLGRLTKVTDAVGHTNTYTYNSLGQVISSVNQDLGTTTATYDAGGLIVSATDAKGQTTTASYDALGRTTSKTSGGQTTYWYYDESGHGSSIGRLTRIVYPTGSDSFTYGTRGLLMSMTKTIGSVSQTMSNTYDSLGRVQTLTYPDGEIVTYTYGADGSLAGVNGYVNSINYGPNGEITQIAYANGTITNYTYDPNRLWLTHANVTLNGTTLYAASYSYDAMQRVTSMTQGTPTLQTTNYTYDNLDRLLSVSGAQTQSFSYDAVGNITYNSLVGSYTYGNAAHPHAVTAAGSSSYTYDASGNMLSGGARTFAWDSHDRLASVTQNGVTTSFGYGASTDRLSKTSGANTTLYFNAYSERVNGSNIQYYYAGPILVAKKDAAGNKTWYHADRLGSTRLMTNAVGADVKDYDYRPFGSIAASTGSMANERTFTGQIADAETGLMYYGARYYDATLGRFISADSATGSAENPQDLNAYSYCANNPVNATDPSGHAWILAGVQRYTYYVTRTVAEVITHIIPYVVYLPMLQFYWQQVTITASVPSIVWTPWPTLVWNQVSYTFSVPAVRIVWVPVTRTMILNTIAYMLTTVAMIGYRQVYRWVNDAVATVSHRVTNFVHGAAHAFHAVVNAVRTAGHTVVHAATATWNWAAHHPVAVAMGAAIVVGVVLAIVLSGGVAAAALPEVGALFAADGAFEALGAAGLTSRLLAGGLSAGSTVVFEYLNGTHDPGTLAADAVTQGGIGFLSVGVGQAIGAGVKMAGLAEEGIGSGLVGKLTSPAFLTNVGANTAYNFTKDTLNNHLFGNKSWGASLGSAATSMPVGTLLAGGVVAMNFNPASIVGSAVVGNAAAQVIRIFER